MLYVSRLICLSSSSGFLFVVVVAVVAELLLGRRRECRGCCCTECTHRRRHPPPRHRRLIVVVCAVRRCLCDVQRMENTWKNLLCLALLATLFGTTYCIKDDKFNVKEETILENTENTTDYRLPHDVIPCEYFVKLTPFIVPDNFTFNGVVKIIANVRKTISKIVLHAEVSEIQHITVSKINGNNVPLDKLELQNFTTIEKYQFLNLFLKSSITAGSRISIEISYVGTLYEDSVGFFRSAYKVNNETRWLAGTHLEPAQARYVFPCFDEPAFKAVFHISIVPPKNYTALSNMPVKSIKNGLVEFEKTPPMSTYIIAIVVSEFQSFTKPGEKHSYKVWANPDLIDQVPYAFSVMSKAIDFFESHLSIPYALPKLEIVAMPDFIAGAMENWGLPLYRESFMLYDPKVTPISSKRFIRNAVTHELTHQWFGNLVTPKLWDYLWVSEAFAAYFEYHAHEDALASWHLDLQFVVNEMQPSLYNDALLATEPVTRNVYSVDEIIAIFDTIVYTKGASLVRMLEKLLGSKMFFGALRRYLLTNQYSTGTPELVYAAIEEEIRCNNYKFNTAITDFLNSWTLQPGYPVIDVDFTGNTARLSQRRFLLKPDNVTDDSTWIIPLNWATGSNPNFSDTRKVSWLSSKQKSITIDNADQDWVIFNVQQTGYYRVNYDTKMWSRIINVLKSKDYQKIHKINRASLIDDLFNLGRAGVLDYDIVLSATQYLTQETNYVPWRPVFEGFTYLKSRFTNHPEIYESFKNYVLSLIEPNYKRLGFNDIAGEQPLDTHLREFVLKWLCAFDHEGCINQALSAFEKLQKNNRYSVPANQQNVVYCTAVKRGSVNAWNYLWDKFQKTKNAIEKLTISSGLACSQNSTNLERLLLTAITPNGGIRKHEIEDVFKYVINAGTVGVQATLNFIQVNYNKMRDYVGDEYTAASFLDSISQLLSTEQDVQKFSNFIKTNNKTMATISESLESSLGNSIYELSWYNKNAPKILAWLKRNYARL